MEVQYRVCCGLDVHRDTVVACLLRMDGPLAERQQTRTFATTFATTMDGLVALGEWLTAAGCGDVAMEATGVFVRRITARVIPPAGRTGSEGDPWVNDLPRGES